MSIVACYRIRTSHIKYWSALDTVTFFGNLGYGQYQQGLVGQLHGTRLLQLDTQQLGQLGIQVCWRVEDGGPKLSASSARNTQQ